MFSLLMIWASSWEMELTGSGGSSDLSCLSGLSSRTGGSRDGSIWSSRSANTLLHASLVGLIVLVSSVALEAAGLTVGNWVHSVGDLATLGAAVVVIGVTCTAATISVLLILESPFSVAVDGIVWLTLIEAGGAGDLSRGSSLGARDSWSLSGGGVDDDDLGGGGDQAVCGRGDGGLDDDGLSGLNGSQSGHRAGSSLILLSGNRNGGNETSKNGSVTHLE